MADNIVTRTDMKNSNEVFQQILLKVAKRNSVYEQKGLVNTANVTNNQYISWFRVNRITPGTPAPLVDGVNPSATKVTTDKITATIDWYGAFAKVASSAIEVEPVKAFAGVTKAIGELAREEREIIIQQSYLSNTTNTFYANAVAGRGYVGDSISETDLKKLFRTMEKAGAEKITQIVKAGAGNNTYPVEACYLLYVTPDQAMDIRGLTTFTKTANYSNPDVAFEGEIGNVCGFRVISTNFLSDAVLPGSATVGSGTTTGKQATASHCDVHLAIAIGAEALGVANLNGGIRNYIKDPKEIGGELEQYGTTGYKMAMAAEVFNTAWVAMLESAVSA